MAGVAGQGAVALEGSDGGVPDVIGNQRGNRSRDDRASIRPGRPASVLEDAPVDGVDDEVADAARAPEALGAFAPDAAAVAPVGRGYTQRVELGCDAHAAPAVDGQVVIDAPDNVGCGEAGPHGRVVGEEAAETSITRDRVAERYDAAGIAAFFGGAVHALGGTFEELAAFVGGDDGVDIEVEGIVDVLVGGAEGDCRSTRTLSRCGAARMRRGRDDRRGRPISWEKRPARASRDKRAASRSLSSSGMVPETPSSS